MSWDALAWAKNTRVGRASDKLILIALADRHNEDCDRAFPSIAWLCDFSDLNRKTVIAALDRLEANGFIEDSGERVGRTQQIKSYKLHWETGPKVERFQKRNSSEITPKQSQKRDTEPSTNHQEPEKQKLSAQPAAARFADWWAVYPKHVARKKAEAIWRNRKLDAIADRLIHDVLTRASDDDGWRRGYVPDPTTYLNQDRWEDDLRTAPVARAGPTQQQPSKTLSAVQTLQGMKHGNLAPRRDSGRIEQAPLLELGSDSGK
jgi:DNA-binding PadR family transcriptional regulator